MGEDQSPTKGRVTVAEAAEILGVSVEAVRGRIKRGTIEHERTPEGLFVLLDTDQTTTERDQSTDQTRPDADQDTYRTVSATEFIQEMRGRIEDLRAQLASERRANEENRRIIAALTQRIPEIEAPPSEAQEPSYSPTEATEQPGRVGPQTEVEAPQERRERRSWWREFFGFD